MENYKGYIVMLNPYNVYNIKSHTYIIIHEDDEGEYRPAETIQECKDIIDELF